MKPILLLLLTACMTQAQNFAVKLGTAAGGTVTNWPVQVQPIGTSTTVTPPFILMSSAQIAACQATNAAAMAAWESNQVYTAKASLETNLARLKALYDGIPAARTELRNFANATNTLTTAQLTTATRKLADYTEKLMEFIQRLGPVLQQMYRPEEDKTQ